MKRKLKLSLLSVAFFLLVFAVIFGVAELLLRRSVIKNSLERRDHVVERPYMPTKFKPNYSGVFWKVPFKTNRYGFRDEPDFPPERQPGVFRILAHGDSIGFGLGIPAADHYTKVLERHLNEAGGSLRYHVVNAAGQGYSPSSYYVYMTHEGRDLQFDMMIVDIEMCTVVTNEALLHWKTDPKDPTVPIRVYGGRYVVGWDGNMLATYATGSYWFEKTYVYTDLVRRSLRLMFRLAPTEPFKSEGERGVTYYNLGFDKYLLDEERLESGWRKAFGALQGLQRICRQRGIPFLVMIFPSSHMYDEPQPYRDFATHLMRRGIARAEELGLPYLDLTEPVREGGGKTLYYDFAHMTSEGNRVVGDALYKRVAAELAASRTSGTQ
jgi:hypothetical protein